MEKYKYLSILLVVFYLAGCGSSPSIDSSYSNTTIPVTIVTPLPLRVTNGTLTLVIYSPADQTVVTESQVDVIGSVSTDVVLTLNGERHILPPGDFTLTVDLEPGENVLQLNVSSLLGNEVELILTVTYQP